MCISLGMGPGGQETMDVNIYICISKCSLVVVRFEISPAPKDYVWAPPLFWGKERNYSQNFGIDRKHWVDHILEDVESESHGSFSGWGRVSCAFSGEPRNTNPENLESNKVESIHGFGTAF